MRLRQARTWLSNALGKKLSQGDIAERLTAEMWKRGTMKKPAYIDQTKVSRFEAGRQNPSVEELEAYQEITTVPADFLAFNTPLPSDFVLVIHEQKGKSWKPDRPKSSSRSAS